MRIFLVLLAREVSLLTKSLQWKIMPQGSLSMSEWWGTTNKWSLRPARRGIGEKLVPILSPSESEELQS